MATAPVEKSRRILLIACEPSLSEAFIASINGVEGTPPTVKIGDVRLALLAASPKSEAQDLQFAMGQCDGALVLMHHADELTLHAARTAVRVLPSGISLPQALVVMREAREQQFKMSCACGQKLLVRDADAGHHGRCPRCGKLFLVPQQNALIKSYLMIANHPVMLSATIGHDASCRASLNLLLEQAARRDVAVKSDTMLIEIPTDQII
jgi:hypothetical protein